MERRDEHSPHDRPVGKVGTNNIERLMRSSLEVEIFGDDLYADIYAQNGFRYLGLPTRCGNRDLEHASVRFRNLLRLNGSGAVKSQSIRVGYEEYCCQDQVEEKVVSLSEDPCRRIQNEIFWIHNGEEIFESIRNIQTLNTERALDPLEDLAVDNGETGTLARHDLAVIFHNRAIEAELKPATKNGKAEHDRDDYWRKALLYWAKTYENPRYWDYLRQRVADLDDPRIKPEDINGQLKGCVLEAILAISALMVRFYVRAGKLQSARRHVAIILQSPLPKEATDKTFLRLAARLLEESLEPLIHRMQNPEGTTSSPSNKSSKKGGRLSRKEFVRYYDPIVKEVFRIHDEFLTGLGLPAGLVNKVSFDAFCDALLAVLNDRIDFQSDDRVRSLLYSLITVRHISTLPHSTEVKRKLEQAIRSDTQYLYSDFDMSNGVDPSQCWFLKGQAADPDASILLPVYRVTDQAIFSTQWRQRQVLIPRSKVAQQFHENQIGVAEVARQCTQERAGPYWRQIQQIEEEAEEAKKRVQSAQREGLDRVRSDFEQELNDFNRACAQQERQDQKRLKQVEEHYEFFKKSVETSTEEACRKAECEGAKPIAASEKNRDRIRKALRRGKGMLRVHLPLCGLFVPGGAVLGGYLSSIQILPPRLIEPQWLPLAVGAGVGLLFGAVWGELLRAAILGHASRRLNAAQARLRYKKDDLTRKGNRQIRKAKKRAEKDVLPERRRLTTNAKHRQALKDRRKRRESTIKEEADARLQEIEARKHKRLKPLKKRLASLFKIKGESKKLSFPGYVGALNKGFQPGERPPPQDTDALFNAFLQRLDYDQINKLSFLGKHLNSERFADVVDEMYKLPIHKWNQFLRRFNR